MHKVQHMKGMTFEPKLSLGHRVWQGLLIQSSVLHLTKSAEPKLCKYCAFHMLYSLDMFSI